MTTMTAPLDEVVHTETHWRTRCLTCGRLVQKPKGVAHLTDPWDHVGDSKPRHPVDAEVRAAIDATCPRCDYGEIAYVFAEQEFACSRCGWHDPERPVS